jgi:hypothetical protein
MLPSNPSSSIPCLSPVGTLMMANCDMTSPVRMAVLVGPSPLPLCCVHAPEATPGSQLSQPCLSTPWSPTQWRHDAFQTTLPNAVFSSSIDPHDLLSQPYALPYLPHLSLLHCLIRIKHLAPNSSTVTSRSTPQALLFRFRLYMSHLWPSFTMAPPLCPIASLERRHHPPYTALTMHQPRPLLTQL